MHQQSFIKSSFHLLSISVGVLRATKNTKKVRYIKDNWTIFNAGIFHMVNETSAVELISSIPSAKPGMINLFEKIKNLQKK